MVIVVAIVVLKFSTQNEPPFLLTLGTDHPKLCHYCARDLGSIPGLGRSPKGGNGYLLQYSYLENPMDTGAWKAILHGMAKSQTRLSD